jgi:predicted transcriptional regulator
MLHNLLDALFGCTHKNFTFPMSGKHGNSVAGSVTGTYVVCLDCGKEFAYDWREMKIVSNPEKPVAAEAYADRVA